MMRCASHHALAHLGRNLLQNGAPGACTRGSLMKPCELHAALLAVCRRAFLGGMCPWFVVSSRCSSHVFASSHDVSGFRCACLQSSKLKKSATCGALFVLFPLGSNSCVRPTYLQCCNRAFFTTLCSFSSSTQCSSSRTITSRGGNPSRWEQSCQSAFRFHC